MTKRARGSVRPGQRRPIQRRGAAPGSPATGPASGASGATAAPRPTGLTEAEIRRAAEVEAQLLAEERAAEEARRRARPAKVERDAAPAGSLAIRAQHEYAYVARDIKDIARISVLLFAILFVAWLLIDVLAVFG